MVLWGVSVLVIVRSVAKAARGVPCEVHWVVKQIQAAVHDGVLLEHTIDTIPFANDSGQHWDPDDSNWYTLSLSLTLADPPRIRVVPRPIG